MALTKRIVDSVAYRGNGTRRHVIWDDDPVGLGLRVFPSGLKTFVLSYRVNGRKRLLTLGSLGVLQLDDARKQAKAELLGVETCNADPVSLRRQRDLDARTGTVAALFTTYVATRRPKYRSRMLREAELHILPAFGTRPWRSLRRSELRSWHSEFRSPYVANRSLQALRAALYWRLWQEDDSPGDARGRSGGDGRNPCAGIRLRPERTRQARLELAQVPAIERAIEAQADDRYVRAYFRFLIAMGCRKSEALSLRWSDVVLCGRDSTVSFRETKNGEDRVVPMPTAVWTELGGLPRVPGNPFVFVGRKPGQPLKSVAKAWQRIRAHAGLPHLRLHDLRRSFGSWLGDAGFTSKQIGTVLGHKTDITSRVYMALGHESKRAAVDAVQDILSAARLEGGGPKPVPFVPRRATAA